MAAFLPQNLLEFLIRWMRETESERTPDKGEKVKVGGELPI